MSNRPHPRVTSDDESEPSILKLDTESSDESVSSRLFRVSPNARIIPCDPARRTARNRLTARKTTWLPERATLPTPAQEKAPAEPLPPAPVPAPQRVGPRMITTARKTVRMRVPPASPPPQRTPPRIITTDEESVASREPPATIPAHEYHRLRDYVRERFEAHDDQWRMQRMYNADATRDTVHIFQVTQDARRTFHTAQEDHRRFKMFAYAWAFIMSILLMVCMLMHFM